MRELLVIVAVLAALMAAPPAARAADVDFNRDVLPVLAANCFACHGPDADARKADLRLDEAAGARAALAPGEPGKSEFLARLTAPDAEGRMPPPKHGARLHPEQVAALRAWVEQGAPYAEHWAFVPPKKPAVPTTRHPVANPIDAFIRARLERDSLVPAPRAGHAVLVRRATLDLLGLPPTPAEVEAFATDDRPDAYERLVDRLLASPHYGERWGRHWLDVARYADSGGFETDIFYASAWRYRDYVIRSFNADKPFDRFVKEQIAGDALYPGDRAALVATGLYAVGPVLEEAKMVTGKIDDDWLADAADTTGAAFLGLTVGCARCHDHKYDPFSQRDYYALQATFAAGTLFDYRPDGSALRENVFLIKREKEFTEVRKQADPKGGDYPELPVRGLGRRTKALDVRLLKRGELGHPGGVVPAALPVQLAGGVAPAPGAERVALAEWVASPRNPLTARVIVNRIWQGHFGAGLVGTPNDLGTRGDRPTHPDLLDWLAVEFVERGWSLKQLHKLILLSETYRQSSGVRGAGCGVRSEHLAAAVGFAAITPHSAPRTPHSLDPENRLLARFQPRRVEAEVVWDAMRTAAGTLDRTMYGLPVFPPLDPRELIGNYRTWVPGPAADANRRAVYVVVRRSFRFPPLGAFDQPENVSSCGRRDSTVVPTQALALLNNGAARAQADAFAARLLRETDGSPAAVADRAWRHAYGRPITADERREAVAFLRGVEQAPPAGATDPRRAAVRELCVAVFNTSEFVYLP